MASYKKLKGVLHDFLGAYLSRYTHYHGYWLFGFLVADVDKLEFDLLEQTASIEPALEKARTLAAAKFRKQMAHAHLDMRILKNATMRVERLPQEISRICDVHARKGHILRFNVHVTTLSEKRFTRESLAFVSPHDPCCEHQSAGTDG